MSRALRAGFLPPSSKPHYSRQVRPEGGLGRGKESSGELPGWSASVRTGLALRLAAADRQRWPAACLSVSLAAQVRAGTARGQAEQERPS